MQKNKKHIYLTVDTECHHLEDLNKDIYGKTKQGKVYGIEKIFQLGKELKIPVNVFLDIPECYSYGDEHIKKIIDLANQYNHPVYLHVHPNFICDSNRKHLWEYTEDEQRDILRTALKDYFRFCGHHTKVVFKAGAWGVNGTTYKVLRELLPEGEFDILDVSYVYNSRWRCHLSYKEYGAANAPKIFRGVTCLPNLTYIGFDYFGKKITSTLSVPNPNFGEFKKIIDNNTLNNITYTMHSWDFIKQWFFLPSKIAGNKRQIRIFRDCVAYCRNKGYEFSTLDDFVWEDNEDQCINICKGIKGKLICLWYNFFTFANVGRSYKKYALLYFSPAILFLLVAIILCFSLIR